MEIVWSGHSCFTVRGKETTLVFDPCPSRYGCASRWGKPQVVLMSHLHPGHAHAEEFAAQPRVFCGPGEYEVGGAFITALGTYHDTEEGATRGGNTVFSVELDGLSLCHVGDLGHPLSGQVLREIGKVDILFVPTGDVSTISVAEARSLVRAVQPRYVLPMHYRSESTRPELEPVETFLSAMAIEQPDRRARLSVTVNNLPLATQVVVLECDGRVG